MSRSPKDAGRGGFDPYHRWLGIPPGQRPPTHYQLLGVSPDEQDSEVIHAAALRQSSYVRNFQSGQYAEAASRVLSELAEARAVLTDPARRKRYDATRPPATAPTLDRSVEPATGDDLGFAVPLARHSRERPPGRSPVVLWVVGGTVSIALVVAIGVIRFRGASAPPESADRGSPERSSAADPRRAASVPSARGDAPRPREASPPTPTKGATTGTPDPPATPAEPRTPPVVQPPAPAAAPAPALPPSPPDPRAWLKDVPRLEVHLLVQREPNPQNWRWITGSDREAKTLPKSGWDHQGLLGFTSGTPLPGTTALWRHPDAKTNRFSYYLGGGVPRSKEDGILGFVWTEDRPGLKEVVVVRTPQGWVQMVPATPALERQVREQRWRRDFSFHLIAPESR